MKSSPKSLKVLHKGSEEARNELPDLIDDAQNGRSTIITRHGKPVAALVPLEIYRAAAEQQSVLGLEGSGRGLWGVDSRETLAELRDEWQR
jgi:prevent-host-death family protein